MRKLHGETLPAFKYEIWWNTCAVLQVPKMNFISWDEYHQVYTWKYFINFQHNNQINYHSDNVCQSLYSFYQFYQKHVPVGVCLYLCFWMCVCYICAHGPFKRASIKHVTQNLIGKEPPSVVLVSNVTLDKDTLTISYSNYMQFMSRNTARNAARNVLCSQTYIFSELCVWCGYVCEWVCVCVGGCRLVWACVVFR